MEFELQPHAISYQPHINRLIKTWSLQNSLELIWRTTDERERDKKLGQLELTHPSCFNALELSSQVFAERWRRSSVNWLTRVVRSTESRRLFCWGLGCTFFAKLLTKWITSIEGSNDNGSVVEHKPTFLNSFEACNSLKTQNAKVFHTFLNSTHFNSSWFYRSRYSRYRLITTVTDSCEFWLHRAF